MAKKQKRADEEIPKPKEDIKRENGSFKMDLAAFVKKTEKKPKK